MDRMRRMLLMVIFLLSGSEAFSQGETAVPFLMIPTSVAGNGMGGIAASLVSDDAMSTIANPAQLGIFSLDNVLSVSTYSPRTAWLQTFTNNMSLDVTALNAGINLKKYLDLPLPVSFGMGYSQIYFDLGEFNYSGPSSPEPIGTYHAYETCDNLSFGVGVDYKVKLSLGYAFKWIGSELAPFGAAGGSQSSGVAKVPAHDYGAILQVPVIDIVSDISETPIEINNKVAPMFDLTFGCARRNEGGEVNHGTIYSDPLPRQGVLGWNFEAGFKSKIHDKSWKLLTFTWGREAEDVLVNVTSVGDTGFARIISYKDGLGSIRPFENLVVGKAPGKIYLQTGWQFQIAECIYIRGGSYTAPGDLSYSTHGESFKLNGFLRLLSALNIVEEKSDLFSLFLNHFDLQYHHSYYSSLGNPIDETTYHSINVVVK
jgi:hypothetical protein